MFQYIDTHAHLDGEEFREDLQEVVQRAKEAGAKHVFVPSIDLHSIKSVSDVCRQNEGFLLPMIGLHAEEVKDDYKEVLAKMRIALDENLRTAPPSLRYIAIGEVGLDFYWSREYEAEQLIAFEEQVKWAATLRLPLMIHCRKGQNEMLPILKRYQKDLVGGVFHCFTGNEKEAGELLQFSNFALGIGGVLTFRKSHLPEVLPHIPLERIVLETDAPYMAPVPVRGKRNESAFVPYIIEKIAACYGTDKETIAKETSRTAERIFLRNTNI